MNWRQEFEGLSSALAPLRQAGEIDTPSWLPRSGIHSEITSQLQLEC